MNLQSIDETTGDSIRRLKIERLADETSRLLFGHSTSLLDDIFHHPLSIDYFNVYLSLPIFGQRVLYHRKIHQLDFDPPLASKFQTNNQLCETTKQWLIDCRLDNYIHTDIYIECLLVLLLIKSDESIHVFIDAKEVTIEEQSHIFSTVTDVRQFHQFLQSTRGIKYWNFFIDSMRVLQSRYSTRFHRIDISHLNFIHKYYSRQQEFRSITIDCTKSSMPDSSTSDTIWFQMAINAMYQLRTYWLPRYLTQISSTVQTQIKQSILQQMETYIEPSSANNDDNSTTISLDHRSHKNVIPDKINLIKIVFDNISYLDYYPRQHTLIETSKEHGFQQDNEVLNKFDDHQTAVDHTLQIQEQPSSEQSIEDYASDDNLELFYRIFVSDSLAGGPFSDYIALTLSKTEAVSLQTCIRFITDAEVVLSLPSGNFKTRILKQFISRYLTDSTTDYLSLQLFDNIEEQRTELIKELLTENTNEASLLWKMSLKLTKILIPHFLNYVKFDRIRCLIQTTSVIDDLHQYIPSINFKELRIDQHANLKQTDSNEKDVSSEINLKYCGIELDDLRRPFNENQYHTVEKRINTDEQCEFRSNEQFYRFTDDEFKPELRQFCTEFQWQDTKPISDRRADAQIISAQPDLITSINESKSIDKIKQNPTLHTYLQNNQSKSINEFTLHKQFDSSPSSFRGVIKEFTIDDFGIGYVSSDLIETNISIDKQDLLKFNTKLKLYTDNHLEFLFANVYSCTIDPEKQELQLHLDHFTLPQMTQLSSKRMKRIHNDDDVIFHESIYFAPKDKSNEIKTSINESRISSWSNDDQKQLLTFIQSELIHQQWPVQEYIGMKEKRKWRSLKLAIDISNLNEELIENYHHDFDWITTNYDLGSFGERTPVIQQNISKQITNDNDCCLNPYCY
ncbi:hypothetical protein I4U23_008038 [Adineta vaga]|nr:hypothetical protein I4U23_008038 [Adineta vaga]